MTLVNLLLSLPLLAAALPSIARSNHVLHEKRQSLGRWIQTDRVHPDAIIPLRIGLTQTDLDSGMDRLMDVSHPSSPNYGKYLSAEEINDIFKPKDETIQQVKAWLMDEGIEESQIVHADNLGWLAVDLPASLVETLFNTEYYLHEHPEKGLHTVGCDAYSVPAHLSDHIDYIRPGVKFSTPIRDGLKKRDATGTPHRSGPMAMKPDNWGPPPWHGGQIPEDLRACGVNITPPCIQALYNLPKEVPAVAGLELGLFEQGSYFDSSDLNLFFKNYAPWVPQGTIPTVKSVDGGEAPIVCTNPNDCGEADIDIDLATSLIYPQKVEVFQVDDSYYAPKEVALDNTFNTFLDALDGSYCKYTAFGITGDSPGIDPKYPDPHKGGFKGKLECGLYTPPKVISASYGESEEDFPANYARRQCNEFMKLGLAGTSMFVSSGDYGVAQPAGDPPGSNGCLSNEKYHLNGTIFNPSYPSDCPYVTSVGATMLPRNGSVYDPELTMWVPSLLPDFSSSGGFSNFYPMPSYQANAVNNYLQNHVPDYPYYTANANGTNFGQNGGIYARGGRGFPDVSANGAYLLAYVAGELGSWFGTSLASPIFASVITLINEERAKAGKPTVGFVNPVLYENAWALNDITKGPNPNCGTKGFPAVEGWDPATGLGTPNYPKLLEVFMKQ